MAKGTFEILRSRYPSGQYALMSEVSDAAGSGRSRSADYVFMSLWPSRGLNLEGVERKSYRSDWLREIKNPAKAENIYRYCDRWWLLTDKPEVAKLEEIPETWGWMHVAGGKMKIMKEAPRLTPEPLSRSFLAALLKRAESKEGYILASSIDDKIAEAVKYSKDTTEKKLKVITEELAELKKNVFDFERETGIRIRQRSQWQKIDYPAMGRAISYYLDGGAEQEVKRLKNLETTANQIIAGIHSSIEVLEGLTNQIKSSITHE